MKKKIIRSYIKTYNSSENWKSSYTLVDGQDEREI